MIKSSDDDDQTTGELQQQPAIDQDSTQLPLMHIITSVLAAAVGVQSKKNQEKDFNAKGSIYIYIAAGIIFTGLFVITVAIVVKGVLTSSGL
tara:strand:- start:406 stop:681 length:276 start_codon:yes stop_codon:yes gene_type:complete